MKKKDLIEEIANRTGFSESHIAKVLQGSRYNETIIETAEEIENEESEKEEEEISNTQKETSNFSEGRSVKQLNVDEIADLLKRVRVERGLSHDELAERMGCTVGRVRSIEEDISNGSIDQFFAWFIACRCNIDFKLTWV